MKPNFRILHWSNLNLLVLLIILLSVIAAAETQAAACISGFVKDKAGNPVANGDIDLINVNTGVKLVTPNDNTDAGGFYSICVLPGLYTVTYAPPDSSHLIGKKILFVDLTNNQPQAINIIMDSGLVISGSITDPVGQPVPDVDIDADSIGGGRVFTPNDNSNLITGAYWIVVPPGAFRLRFDSPVGSRLLGQELASVSITVDTIINMVLPEGWLLSGKVTNSLGLGLAQVEIGLRYAATGEKLFISNKDTDTAGHYQVAVPTGLYELRFAGLPGSDLVGARTDSLNIFADMIWDQQLEEGLVLSVRVQDELGVPIPDADIDLKLTSSGEKLFTPNDQTDISGLAVVALLPDNYQLEVDPPLGSPYDQVIIKNLNLAADTTVIVTLPTVTRLSLTGRVIDTDGFGLPEVQINLFSSLTGQKVFLVNNVTDSLGWFTTAAPAGQFDMTVAPPSGSRLVGEKIIAMSLNSDSQLDPITLSEGLMITVSVIDHLSIPVADVDLDLTDSFTGEEQFTPRDNTDEAGIAVIVVKPGDYTFLLEPATASNLSPLSVARISLGSDTLLTFLLGVDAPEAPTANFELGQNYPNPFNTNTFIPVNLVTGSYLTIEIFNILGQKVTTLIDGQHAASAYNFRWSGSNSTGHQIASGIYFYRVSTPFGTDTRRLVLIK